MSRQSPEDTRLAPDDGDPVVAMAEAEDRPARILHARGLLGIASLALGELVVRPVDVDAHVVIVIDEVGPCAARRDENLSAGWQCKAVRLEQLEPGSLE